MATLFISDLHLTEQRPDITKLFLQFLDSEARQARALYILGDLFEAWLGDDCILAEYHPVIKALKSLTEQGVPVYVAHGNRDFLMGETFEQLSGCKLLADHTVIELDNQKILVMHGDTLCTDDVEYQQFRSMVRSPSWQKEMLAKTPQQRITLAKQFRQISTTETAIKITEIMDVNQDTVQEAMLNAKVSLLIHGHTHRPAIHKLMLNNQKAQRIVLGDWYNQGSVLRIKDNQFDLAMFT